MIYGSTISEGAMFAGAAPANSKDLLGKSDFLHLLVTQLQCQDPLNPMDSTEFTSQLAQFSSLEQLTNVNDNLTDIYSSQQSFQNSQAVSFIGRNVKAVDSTVHVDGSGSRQLEFELGAQAGKVFVYVYDEQETTVRRFEMEGVPAGENSVSWDGMNDQGKKVPKGVYRYEIFGVGMDDQPIAASPYTVGRVTGVSFSGGDAVLKLGETSIGLGKVVEVKDAG